MTDVVDARHLQIHRFADLVPGLDDLVEWAGRKWRCAALVAFTVVVVTGYQEREGVVYDTVHLLQARGFIF